jgi:hypothetical protein
MTSIDVRNVVQVYTMTLKVNDVIVPAILGSVGGRWFVFLANGKM